MNTTATVDFMNDTFKGMTESFTDAMQTAMKFNEETTRFWTDTFTRTTEDFRNRNEKIVSEFAPFTRENAERFQKSFQTQTDRTMKMMRETMETMRPTTGMETSERAMNMWRDSFDNVRESMDTFARANQDMLRSWTEFFNTTTRNAANTANKVAAKSTNNK
ncbi:MAG: hypothetical protein AB7N71_12325 [Phycisphaerae bacterium]